MDFRPNVAIANVTTGSAGLFCMDWVKHGYELPRAIVDPADPY